MSWGPSITRLKTSLHGYSSDFILFSAVGLCSIYYVDEQGYISLKLLWVGEELAAHGLERLLSSLCTTRNASDIHVEFRMLLGIDFQKRCGQT